MESEFKVFVDTNVIANWLISTNVCHSEATEFMRMCFGGMFSPFVSSHSLTDLFYITRKHFIPNERFDFIRLLINSFTVLIEDSAAFSDAIGLGSPDLEDALQIVCAERENVDFIVTENIKDFSLSSVPVLSIGSALKKLKAEE